MAPGPAETSNRHESPSCPTAPTQIPTSLCPPWSPTGDKRWLLMAKLHGPPPQAAASFLATPGSCQLQGARPGGTPHVRTSHRGRERLSRGTGGVRRWTAHVHSLEGRPGFVLLFFFKQIGFEKTNRIQKSCSEVSPLSVVGMGHCLSAAGSVLLPDVSICIARLDPQRQKGGQAGFTVPAEQMESHGLRGG